MLSVATIEVELSTVKRKIKEASKENREYDNAALYGAQQALMWALKLNAQKPSKAFS